MSQNPFNRRLEELLIEAHQMLTALIRSSVRKGSSQRFPIEGYLDVLLLHFWWGEQPTGFCPASARGHQPREQTGEHLRDLVSVNGAHDIAVGRGAGKLLPRARQHLAQ